MPQPKFKAGDRVRLINNEHFDPVRFPLGSLATLLEDPYEDDGEVYVFVQYDHRGAENNHKLSRFELVEAAPARPDAFPPPPAAPVPPAVLRAAPDVCPFKVGDVVRCINAGVQPGLNNGEVYVVMSVGRKDFEGFLIEVKGNPMHRHYHYRFELVKREFKVGDKVKVVRKVEAVDQRAMYWVREMEPLLNNGKEYSIEREESDGIWYLSNGWLYLEECLEHADVVPVKKEEQPVLKVEDLKKGDKVYVVRKVEADGKGNTCRWNPEMNAQFKDQKKEYTVKRISVDSPEVLLDNGWWYLVDCIAFVDPPKAKPKKAKKPVVRPIRTILKEEAKAKGPVHICSYALEFENGKHRLQVNDVCHYRVRYNERDEGVIKNLALSLEHAPDQLGKKDLADYRKYTDYIINRSPWASCFLTKSVSAAFNAGILMNVDKPLSQVAGACVALREGIEFDDKLDMFMLMKKKGYHEHTAYLMSFVFRVRKDGKFNYGSYHGGHQSMAGDRNWEQVVEFFKKGFRDLQEKPYREKGNTYEIHNAVADYSRLKKDSFAGFMERNVKKVVEGKGWMAKESITADSIYALADKIDQLFKEQA